MSQQEESRKNFFERLSTTYRVVFIDDESLEETASYRMSLRRLYALISMVFVLIITVTMLLLIFTPVKYYIPGYSGQYTRTEMLQMKQRVDSLSDLVAAQEKYEENIRNVLTGNVKTELDTTMLDLKRTHKEDMNSLLPESDELMKQAAKSVKKENNKQEKK